MKIKYLKEFDKEFKKLSKKYSSLKDDFKDFCDTLELDPTGKDILSNHIVQIDGLGQEIQGTFYKVKKFVCKSISRNSLNSGIRIIYKYTSEGIEFCEIEFIEIYHKNQKENHNIDRIKDYYG